MIVDDLFESPQTCPECGGPAFSDLLLAEKKDACYHKVRSRYKVWPSAYASGALVQCRKKGAANWGNKSESVAEGSGQEPGEFEIYDLRTMQRVYHPFEANDIMDAFVKADDWLEAIGKSGRGLSVRPVREINVAEDQLDEKCWDTHRQAGMKKKGDRMVPNCVPKEGAEEGRFAGDTRVELGGATVKKLQAGDTVSYFGEKAQVVELNPANNYARISANGKTLNVRLSDLKRTGQGMAETDNFRAPAAMMKASPQALSQAQNIVQQQADKNVIGQAKIAGAVPNQGVDEGDKIGNMDADRFDDAMSRLKQLAGQGPRKTVWDPVKRVYKTVPVSQQPVDKK